MSKDRNCSTQSQTTTGQQTSSFTDHERDVTGYLFAKLVVLYANTFYLVYPSEKEVNFAKREYAKEIGRFTREQIDVGMRHLAKLAISTERDDRIYREPNLPAILAMLDETARPKRAHKLFEPLALPDKVSQEKAKEVGRCELDRLMTMFAEPEKPPLTQAEIADKQRAERLANEH